MEQVRTALDQVLDLLLRAVAFVLGAIGVLEAWLRGAMQQAGLPQGLQTVVLVLVAVLLVVAAFRLLGGFLRLLVILFLVLLVVQVFGLWGDGPRRYGQGGIQATVLPA